MHPQVARHLRVKRGRDDVALPDRDDPPGCGGRRLGMQGYGVGTISDLYLHLVLQRAGLRLSDIDVGSLGFAETNSGLANRKRISRVEPAANEVSSE